MLRSASRLSAAVAAFALAAPVAFATHASPRSSAGWRVVYRVRTGIVDAMSVTAPSRHDAWAVAGIRYSRTGRDHLLVLHWNGSAWHRIWIPHPPGFRPSYVASSSRSSVWIFGYTATFHSTALWFDGAHWHDTTAKMPRPAFDPGLYGRPAPPVVITGPDVWATGLWSVQYPQFPHGANTLWNWRNNAWTDSKVRAVVTDCGATAGAGQHIWLLAAPNANANNCGTRTFRPVIYWRDGTAWRKLANPERRIRWPSYLAASPRGDLWLLARPAHRGMPYHLDHWNGTRWTRQALPRGWPLNVITYDGRGGIWLGEFAHWTGTRWVKPPTCACEGDAMAVIPGSSSLWSFGYPELGSRAEIFLYRR